MLFPRSQSDLPTSPRLTSAINPLSLKGHSTVKGGSSVKGNSTVNGNSVLQGRRVLRRLGILAAVLLLSGCQLLTPQVQPQVEDIVFSEEQQQQHNNAAETLFADYVNWRIEQSPVLASHMGLRGQFDWDDISSEYQELHNEALQQFHSRLKTINELALNRVNRASYQTLLNQVEFQLLQIPLVHLREPFGRDHNWLLISRDVLLNHHPINSVEDAHDYIDRIEALPSLMKRWQEALQQRQQLGLIPAANILRDNQQLAASLARSLTKHTIEDSIFWRDFEQKIAALALYPSSETLLKSKLSRALTRYAAPAYGEMQQFLAQLENDAPAISRLSDAPQGMRYYQLLLAHYSETDLDASRLFQLMLAHVADAQQSLLQASRRLGFEWSADATDKTPATDKVPEAEKTGAISNTSAASNTSGNQEQSGNSQTLTQLRAAHNYLNSRAVNLSQSDPQLTQQALLGYQRQSLQTLADDLPYYFAQLPQTPLALQSDARQYQELGVQPSGSASRHPTELLHYRPAMAAGDSATLHWNPQRLSQASSNQILVANIRQAVPGRHIQIALAQENSRLPEFRSQPYLAEFNRGWPLFALHLGAQHSREHFDQLPALASQQVLLAATLATVDIGLHAKGWERLAALDYLTQNSHLDVSQAQQHIDVLLLHPAQAVAEFMGFQHLLKIEREMAARDKRAIDPSLWIKQWLQLGAVPMNTAEQQLELWFGDYQRERARLEQQQKQHKEQAKKEQEQENQALSRP